MVIEDLARLLWSSCLWASASKRPLANQIVVSNIDTSCLSKKINRCRNCLPVWPYNHAANKFKLRHETATKRTPRTLTRLGVRSLLPHLGFYAGRGVSGMGCRPARPNCAVLSNAMRRFNAPPCKREHRTPIRRARPSAVVWHSTNRHLRRMCGRVTQRSGPIRYGIVDGIDVRDSRVHNYSARWNAAPSHDFLCSKARHVQADNVPLRPVTPCN